MTSVSSGVTGATIKILIRGFCFSSYLWETSFVLGIFYLFENLH